MTDSQRTLAQLAVDTFVPNRGGKGGKMSRPHSPGPRTMHDKNTGPKTVVERKGKTGFIKKFTSSSNLNRNSKFQPNRYRVSLPKEYQSEAFVHFSRRAPKEYKRLKRNRSQNNTFFSRERNLPPSPSPISRQADPNLSRKVNFGKLCLDLLDIRVEDEKVEIIKDTTIDESTGRHVVMGESRRLSDWNGFETGQHPSSSVGLHRSMSSNERNFLRPMTASLRKNSGNSEYIFRNIKGTHKKRPLSASASIRSLRSIETNGPKLWVPRHHHPQILGNLTIQTSKGKRRISKVIRHVPKHRSTISTSYRKSMGGLIPPVSTRNGPHLPVNWGL